MYVRCREGCKISKTASGAAFFSQISTQFKALRKCSPSSLSNRCIQVKSFRCMLEGHHALHHMSMQQKYTNFNILFLANVPGKQKQPQSHACVVSSSFLGTAEHKQTDGGFLHFGKEFTGGPQQISTVHYTFVCLYSSGSHLLRRFRHAGDICSPHCLRTDSLPVIFTFPSLPIYSFSLLH